MEMINGTRAQGFRNNWSVIDKHHRTQSREEVSVAVIWKEALVPVLAEFRCTLLHCEVKKFVLLTGLTGSLEHLPCDSL